MLFLNNDVVDEKMVKTLYKKYKVKYPKKYPKTEDSIEEITSQSTQWGNTIPHQMFSMKDKKYYNSYNGKWSNNPTPNHWYKQPYQIYDFDCINKNDLITEFQPHRYESVMRLVMRVYKSTISQFNKVDEGEIPYVVLPNHWCRNIIGEDFKEVVNKLYQMGILSSVETNKNVWNNDSLIVVINPSILKSKYVITPNTNQILHRKLTKYYQSQLNGMTEVEKYVVEVISKTDFKGNEVNHNEILNELIEKKNKEFHFILTNPYYNNNKKDKVREILKNGEEYVVDYTERYLNRLPTLHNIDNILERREGSNVKTSKSCGRVSHIYSNLPTPLREYLRIDGEKLIEYDIVESQPSILLHLIVSGEMETKYGIKSKPTQWCEMIQQYKNDGKSVYHLMIDKLGLDEDTPKSYLKPLLFKILYGRVGSKKQNQLIIDVFGEDMLGFITEIQSKKLFKTTLPYKNLPIMLMNEESSIMNKIILECKKWGIDILPLYDGIWVKPNDTEDIETILNKVSPHLQWKCKNI